MLVRLFGHPVGRNPVDLHAATELAPVRTAVRGYLESRGSDMAGDDLGVERIATRIGAFRALRAIGRAAKGAAMFATAPARALGQTGINTVRTATNLAKGVEAATALTTYVTKPLAWRPSKKKKAPGAANEPEGDADNPEQEEQPMNDETSGSPKPQERHIQQANSLISRARWNPFAARRVANIAKAAAQGHPGARLAQAAIVEARKKPPRQAPPRASAVNARVALPPVSPAHQSSAFPAWARGAM